ncbi:Uncharacterized metal-binding protein YceD, DUF177 family [Cyclonatronum proteinivorum]|uniref:Uncharacterized metal-binding protein YceD, DUF177 family n=1 Tax=Cyclonatronum proteinivorum TaxID=1457365 RepID=A0A345UM32_9BACT|nr:DUF177 domain-containing protein [Cyclonatronum proteinivorum]AXJ01534.1 Uncharacterized metal-binding protein YceD, DUF177 family [Cyclonatronum proteinivorum]
MKFRISDIPDSKSNLQLALDERTFKLEECDHGPVQLNVEFVKMLNTIQVSFEASVTLQLTCDRSLEVFDYPVSVTYKVLFKPNAEPEEDTLQALRPLNTSSNIISIEEEIRDSILLSLPIKKLHPRFLDDDGNPSLFFETFGESPNAETEIEETDDRWAALKKLKNNS